jgi:hypothetical protein
MSISPNREVKPLETWDANIGLILGREKKKDVADVVLKCAYEGSRKGKGQDRGPHQLDGGNQYSQDGLAAHAQTERPRHRHRRCSTLRPAISAS